jgi:hypothetical protein
MVAMKSLRATGAMVAIGVLVLTTSACWPIPKSCTTGVYDLIAQPHGASSPELAVKEWLKTTSTPGTQLPPTGWHVKQGVTVDAQVQTVILQSGGTTATATRLPDHSWMVTTFTQCSS